ncbi:ribosomal protein L35 [Thiovulum sp. ES]|nr:ribosomal protein L35 [Thiovulum sp. ES]
MPKMKTHKGASKRFKAKKNSIKRGSAFRSHILSKYSAKRKRGLRSPKAVSKSDESSVKVMLGI